MSMKRETTATFIGHNECYGVSKTELQNEIKKLIEKRETLNGKMKIE